jgi:hypothetical protein
MLRRVKVLVLPLLMMAILTALPFSGCQEKASQTEDPSQLDLPQILSDSMFAMKAASSYTHSMEMNMNMEATGGSTAGTASMSMGSNGVTDVASKQMQMNLDISMNQDVPGMEGSLEYKAEIYALKDWIYMKLDIAGMENDTQIEYIKSETIDGSDCYVLKIVPNLAAMKEWLNSQQLTSGSFELSQIENLEDIFKKLSYNVWIAKDTKLIKKMNVQMTAVFSATQLSIEESELDQMTMDVEIKMTLTHYNDPVSITLPDEAENATEI